MPQSMSIDTLIIGGGQAGLAAGYWLAQRGRDYLILEQSSQPASVWRNDRWDSFTLVTPNWSVRMPGAEYQGDASDGFMTRDEVSAYFRDYVDRFSLNVQYGVRVDAVERTETGDYLVNTTSGVFRARNVVVATGLFQRPRLPAFSADLARSVLQIHSGAYRRPALLPPGAVLVVGSGQSGSQIAQELYESGRTVFQSIGSSGRVPRRYRGRDAMEWLFKVGFFDRTPDMLPSPEARFASQPQLSGRGGGRNINLHQFARDGVILLGSLRAGRDAAISLASDLHENLSKSDRVEANLLKLIDDYIERNALDAPPETVPVLKDGFALEERSELDLEAAGVSTVIWATGYSFDFSLVRLPVLDASGYPLQRRGVSDYPGLYFLGLPWLHKMKSGLLLGVGEDADYVVSVITNDKRQ